MALKPGTLGALRLHPRPDPHFTCECHTSFARYRAPVPVTEIAACPSPPDLHELLEGSGRRSSSRAAAPRRGYINVHKCVMNKGKKEGSS